MGFSIHNMDNFNKFLKNTEELILVISPKSRTPRIYFVLTLLILAFFMLWPIWHAGHQGFWLWVALVLFLLFNLIKLLITKGTFYLLTSQSIIFLKAIDDNHFSQLASFDLDKIEKIGKHNSDNIYFVIDNKKFYIFGIKNRNKVFKTIKHNLQ